MPSDKNLKGLYFCFLILEVFCRRVTLVGNSLGTYVFKINQAVIRNGTAILHVTFRSQQIYLFIYLLLMFLVSFYETWHVDHYILITTYDTFCKSAAA